MSERRKQFTFYRSYYDAVLHLNKRDQRDVLMALCAYAIDGAEPNLTGAAATAFILIRPTLDSSRRKADNRIGKGSKQNQNENKNGSTDEQIGNEKEKEEEREKESEKEKESYKESKKESAASGEASSARGSGKSGFVPPTVEAVRDYCMERGNGIDPQAFVDFYASKNWMVGKNKMADWKAAMRTWEQRRKQEGGNTNGSDARNSAAHCKAQRYGEYL